MTSAHVYDQAKTSKNDCFRIFARETGIVGVEKEAVPLAVSDDTPVCLEPDREL